MAADGFASSTDSRVGLSRVNHLENIYLLCDAF
jgi:hypothetical protein